MTDTRKIGVEEEFLLLDPDTLETRPVSQHALRAREGADDMAEAPDADTDPLVEEELFLQQIETATPPCTALDDLRRELVAARRAVGAAAERAGAHAVAVGVPVLGGDPDTTPRDRYQRIVERYGRTAEQSLACAMHIHVDVADREEGVRVLDRIRPWLPVLLALSANSAYWRGHDTKYASWRSEVWRRFPSVGTGEPFGSVAEYDRVAEQLQEWGAALDRGMLYYDARLSEKASTVEVRVADVCTDLDDTVLVAGLARALVATAAEPTGTDPVWRTDAHRAAMWRAARYGAGGTVVDPATRELAPVRVAFESLLTHLRGDLDATGDEPQLRDLYERLASRGGGAARQRKVVESGGDLRAVAADLAARTHESWADSSVVE